MRAHLSDVARHPSWLSVWWDDLPYRKRSWWWEVLREPGSGWLRWKPEWRERISYDPPDLDQWMVYPPLHRLWLAVLGIVMHPRFVLQGDCRWNEWPTWSDVSCLVDEDRRRLYR